MRCWHCGQGKKGRGERGEKMRRGGEKGEIPLDRLRAGSRLRRSALGATARGGGTRGVRRDGACVTSAGAMCPVFCPMCPVSGRMCPVWRAMCPLFADMCPVLGGARPSRFPPFGRLRQALRLAQGGLCLSPRRDLCIMRPAQRRGVVFDPRLGAAGGSRAESLLAAPESPHRGGGEGAQSA